MNDIYTKDDKEVMISTAQKSILFGLSNNIRLELDSSLFSVNLIKVVASFVTLTINKKLRGCIGTLEAHIPLIEDISNNAFYAAFRDTRFSPLSRKEFDKTKIEISILSEHKPIEFRDENDLLSQIQPGIDGLIISDKGSKGTFLPSVWDELKGKKEFLKH